MKHAFYSLTALLIAAGCLTGKKALTTNTLSAPEMREQYIGTIRRLEKGQTSMLPWLSDKDTYRIEAIPFQSLAPNLPILYKASWYRLPIVHRLKQKDRWGNWIAQGDNSPREDPERVTPQNFIGLVVKLPYSAATQTTP